MLPASELARSWSDTISAIAVGSLAILLLAIGQVDHDGSLSFHLNRLNALEDFTAEASGAATFLLGISGITFAMALGYLLIQFGEFLSIFPDRNDRGARLRGRVAKCAGDAALSQMFTSAYTAFRLLCGVGTVLLFSGLWLIGRGVVLMSVNPTIEGLAVAGFAINTIWMFARYSFAHLDWTLFGDLKP